MSLQVFGGGERQMEADEGAGQPHGDRIAFAAAVQ